MKRILKIGKIGVLLSILSCTTTQHYTHTNHSNHKVIEKSKITFLFFEVEKVNGKPHISLVQKKTRDGKALIENNDTRKSLNDYYKISLTDAQNNEIKVFLRDNPLAPIVEVYDKQHIKQVKGKLDKAGFFIRYNELSPSSITNITISHVQNDLSKIIFTQRL